MKKPCRAEPALSTTMGIALFLATFGLVFTGPAIPLLGVAVALAALFHPKYRCVCLGYWLCSGFALLAWLVLCNRHTF